MGRANQKPRKGKQHQHLPKVGSASERSGDGHRERAAVADVMGLGGASPGVRIALMVIAVLVVLAGIIGLVAITL
jgi:hypothetical protein